MTAWTDRDQVAEHLRAMVEHLKLERDRGLAGVPLDQQAVYRKGFSAALMAIGSTAMLVSLVEPVEG